MDATNLLIIMDDEHNKRALGYNAHPMVKTPHLDRMAAQGTVYDYAYSSSPICCPARAALATGRYIHQTRYWDNALAYDGKVPSWAHVLRDRGYRVDSIGKLHYMNDEIDGGFSEQIIPMHIEGGVGDLYGLLRNPLPIRHQSSDLARSIGPGETTYTRYDRDITAKTIEWLQEAARLKSTKPWILLSSFIAPHSPLIAPPEFYELYSPRDIVLPEKPAVRHPWIQAWDDCYRFDSYFESDEQRKIAIASYYGLCSFVDFNVGRIMSALEESGLAHDTRVIFLSDHGDNLGTRGLWGKSNMYEESAGIPLIACGPDSIPGRKVATPVSLVDLYPAILQAVGEDATIPKGLPGRSLFDIADEPYDGQRVVFSEYHAAGSVNACYMLRKGRYKYIHYTGFAPELFDLEADPYERVDLACRHDMVGVISDFLWELNSICDPLATDAAAKSDQKAHIDRHGGAERILARGGSSYTPVPGEQIKLIGRH